MRKLLLLVVAVHCGAAIPVGASVLVGAPGDPSSGNRTPFQAPLPGSPGTLYQQVYNSTDFSGPITIVGLTFFDTQLQPATITFADYTIHLSTTALAVNLSNFLSPDNNLGPDNALFFAGPLGGAIGSSFTISGNAFQYNPSLGNLLLDIRLANIGTRGTGAMDARSGTAGAIFSRIQDFAQGSVSYGLVTQFETPTAGVPEPSTMELAGLGVVLVVLSRRRAIAKRSGIITRARATVRESGR